MQSDLLNMSAEASRAVMVFAMNVVGDCSANGNEARAGRDGKEPSLRQKHIDDVREADAAFAAQHPSEFVESENAVEAAAVDQFAAGVETGIAIAASKAIREQGIRRGSFENLRQLIVPSRFVDMLVRRLRVTSPGEDSLSGVRGCGFLA